MIALVRHGRAVSQASGGDALRWLTLEGRETVRFIGQQLAEKLPPIQAILASPYVRAQQTAELLAAALDHPGPIVTAAELAPDGEVAVARSHLRNFPSSVLAVTHEPLVSGLAAQFTDSPVFGFQTSEVRCFEGAVEVWRISP